MIKRIFSLKDWSLKNEGKVIGKTLILAGVVTCVALIFMPQVAIGSPEIEACIEFTKEADIGLTETYITVTFRFNVTNCGSVLLSNVSVIDDLVDDITLGTTTLAPNQTTDGEGIYVVLKDDINGTIVNSANAFGYDPLGNKVAGIPSFFVINLESILSNPPNIPSDPNPDDDETHVKLKADLSWKSDDIDGDPVTYDVYFGKSYPPPLKMYNQSDNQYAPELHYDTTYYWRIVAWDNHGESNASEVWSFSTVKNNPPSKPTINGSATGHKNISYEFEVFSSDTNNDKLQYLFEWGDGETTVTEFLQNGVKTYQTHRWANYGEYLISVKAFDGETESKTNDYVILIDVLPIDDDIKGYLVDEDSEDTYNLFDNTDSGEQTDVEKENKTYLIDSDGDGKWDYSYNQESGLSTYYEYVYQKYQKIFNDEIGKAPGFEMISLLAMLAVVLIIVKRREGKK